ncbi:uncharacterized protein TRIREDRAFT_106089 [Trichoderma reesei QM6a]|uniref:Predicted protein n=2 Tax=Hypocrea jecorina TaxID=51453 RepID=G0RGA7_HYPJQ|nr:uncharacterized protein TRIREDRAFT_106089 [Trichoderma reesei QM6a]EGR49826.1 predicted protein [Trichoderma reesei QM6a]ETS03469.1 hypothetical protein M419DRAFT_128761 [Trichoderma reesei RUT C-30]
MATITDSQAFYLRGCSQARGQHEGHRRRQSSRFKTPRQATGFAPSGKPTDNKLWFTNGAAGFEAEYLLFYSCATRESSLFPTPNFEDNSEPNLLQRWVLDRRSSFAPGSAAGAECQDSFTKLTCNAPRSAANIPAAATASSLGIPWDQPDPRNDVPAVSLHLAVAP